jgi:hypothetical protein
MTHCYHCKKQTSCFVCGQCCSAFYCGEKCQKKNWNIGHQYECNFANLKYYATGYIDGTRFFWIINHDMKTLENAKTTTLYSVSKKNIDEIWEILQKYCRENIFHIRTEKDEPKCCDIGVTLFSYGNLVVHPQDAPELKSKIENILKKHSKN